MHARAEKYLMGTRFAGIEAEIRAEETVFHSVILKRKGDRLSIERIFKEVKSVAELPVDALKDIPVSLVFTGKGILYRMVQADPNAGPEMLLRKILPNVNAGEFYIAPRSKDSAHFVSLARQSALVPLLTELKQMYPIVSFDIGVSCLQDIQPLLKADNVACGHHVVNFTEDSISSVEYQQDETTLDSKSVFRIGEEEIPSSALVAFAAGLRTAAGNTFSLEQGMRNEFMERRLFRTTLRAALVFIFTVLCANYFIFSYYWNLRQELEAQSGSGGNSLAAVNLLREQVESRTRFLKNAGLLENSSFAWYADQLAHGMPQGIRLSQMNFSPRVNVTEEDTIGFQSGTIAISGNCEESITLNRWIQFLQGAQWVSSASIRSYEQGKTDATGKFTLDLQLQ